MQPSVAYRPSSPQSEGKASDGARAADIEEEEGEEDGEEEEEEEPEFFEPEDLIALGNTVVSAISCLGEGISTIKSRVGKSGGALKRVGGALRCSVGTGWNTLTEAAEFWMSDIVEEERRHYLENMSNENETKEKVELQFDETDLGARIAVSVTSNTGTSSPEVNSSRQKNCGTTPSPALHASSSDCSNSLSRNEASDARQNSESSPRFLQERENAVLLPEDDSLLPQHQPEEHKNDDVKATEQTNLLKDGMPEAPLAAQTRAFSAAPTSPLPPPPQLSLLSAPSLVSSASSSSAAASSSTALTSSSPSISSSILTQGDSWQDLKDAIGVADDWEVVE